MFFSKEVVAFEDENYKNDYILVYDIADVLQVYDQRYSAYIPYIEDYHLESKSVSFWLDLKKFKDFTLVFHVNKSTHIFINKRLAQEVKRDDWFSISIDSLGKIYGYKKLFFTFYNEDLSLPPKSIFIGQKKKTSSKIVKNVEQRTQLERKIRNQEGRKNFISIFILSFFAIYVFLWNFYNKSFLSFYSFRSSLSTLSKKETNLFTSNLSLSGILFLLAHIGLLSFFYEFLVLEQEKTFDIWLTRLGMDRSFWGILTDFLSLYIFILLLFLIKNIVMSVFSLILNVEKILSVHIFEYLRSSMLFYTLLAIIFILFQISGFNQNLVIFVSIIPYILLFFHILQALLMSYYTISLLRNQSLYLFYYLCITELTPLLIGVKILLF